MMKQTGVKILSLLLLSLSLASCQRVINVDVQSATQQLVIEANLTNSGGVQTVSLSNSVGFNNSNVYPPVSGAAVAISTSEGLSYNFKETTPGQYTFNFIRVRPGAAYSLTVFVNNKYYTATSVMPQQVNLDSLGLSTMTFGNKTIKTIVVNYRDPGSVANQYRFVMYVNGAEIKQIFPLSDVGSDGKLIRTVLFQNDRDLVTGDKVNIEMQCIDVNMYNYWLSLSQQGGNGPSNSATPSNPISNINGGALGYFSAHTTQVKSINIP